jgi:outer membrane protein TolC
MRQSKIPRYSIGRITVLRSFLCAGLLYCSNAFSLNLRQAEQLALQSDPSVESFRATSLSFIDESVADDTLPDPKLRLGAVNVPVDTFDLEQEQMTQMVVGIKQDFPRGDSRQYRQQQTELLSRSASALAEDARRKVISEVRQTYLNLYYQIASIKIVEQSKQLFSKLVDITESTYATGRGNQQDVIQAELELAKLDDRLTQTRAMAEGYRAELSQWIGDMAWQQVDDDFPVMPDLPADVDLNKVIPVHPIIRAQTSRVDASRKMAEIASQDYKPGWSASLDYGFRSGNNPDGTERTDFVTALVSLDIPLFTSDRQDRSVAASHEKTAAEQFEKDDRLRKLKRSYDKDRFLWKRLGERNVLYQNNLLAIARDNSRASLNAYQSGITEFDTLMRAQITELDVRLEDLRVQVDRAKAQARLLYITGENNDQI